MGTTASRVCLNPRLRRGVSSELNKLETADSTAAAKSSKVLTPKQCRRKRKRHHFICANKNISGRLSRQRRAEQRGSSGHFHGSDSGRGSGDNCGCGGHDEDSSSAMSVASACPYCKEEEAEDEAGGRLDANEKCEYYP